ncbi:MAG TPA: OmpA family protein [Thermohalobaculum sp.]|nr:OmpA family protein [Thermohalobaculum sp.]
MRKLPALTLAATATMLSACTNEPAGSDALTPLYGEAVRQNIAVQIAYGEGRLRDLAAAFQAETDEMVTFAFDSAALDPTARAAVDTQIAWLMRNPGVRMSVTGHADLVGPDGYNYRLGLRRAQAVVSYMVANGISRNRLDELVSRGENDPLIPTEQRERRNRRVVTTVAGLDRQFVGFGMDGRIANAIYSGYVGN